MSHYLQILNTANYLNYLRNNFFVKTAVKKTIAMSGEYDYKLWIYKCQQIIRQTELQRLRRNKLRHEHGFFEAVFPTLSSYSDKFENYIRMSATQFEELFCLIGPHITKKKALREPISATARLVMTLRYLATGDCITSISYHYLVGVTTTANIIAETCRVIWNCLHPKVLPYPLQTNDWLKIARDFDENWQFPHCIGAIDGKHVQIQCPDNAGSLYYNYKNHDSIVLLGICNADYSFIFVDIGAYGRRSDGGIFRDSVMGQKFEKNEMNVPDSELLTVDGMPLPYVLVGDEAFQLTNYLLRPYPSRGGLNKDRTIFNYRLSRARRTIENSFGLLVSLWRILRKSIDATVENTIAIVEAIICLHNWLQRQDVDNIYIEKDLVDQHDENGFIPGRWRSEVGENSALQDAQIYGNHYSARSAVTIRDEFCDYFNAEGAVPWQYKSTAEI